MKIMYMIGSLAFGGAERQFVELVRGIGQVAEIQPCVCYFTETAHGYKSQLEAHGIDLTLLERKRKYDLGLFRRVHRYTVKRKIDLKSAGSRMNWLMKRKY